MSEKEGKIVVGSTGARNKTNDVRTNDVDHVYTVVVMTTFQSGCRTRRKTARLPA